MTENGKRWFATRRVGRSPLQSYRRIFWWVSCFPGCAMCSRGLDVFVPKVNLKNNPQRRWAQPDRQFFACGACHLLALAYLRRFPWNGYRPFWIRPKPGFTGNHVFVSDGRTDFDYHGYSRLRHFLSHYAKRGVRYYPGWQADVVPIGVGELVGGPGRDGLHLLPPDRFAGDPVRRAHKFLDNFRHPWESGVPESLSGAMTNPAFGLVPSLASATDSVVWWTL